MVNCFQPWTDNFALCEAALGGPTSMGGMAIPGDQSLAKAHNRSIVCSIPECQTLIRVFKELLAANNCPRAVQEKNDHPDGMFQPTYCPVTPVPTTKRPAPTTTAPRLTTPAPAPTITGTPVVLTLAPTVTTPAPTTTLAPVVVPTNAPTNAPTIKNGLDTTTIVTASSGGIIVVLLLIIIILCLRRKRKDKLDQEARVPEDRGFAYAELSSACTDDDTLTETDMLRGGLAIAAVRIPYKTLQFGPVISQGGFGEVSRGLYNDKLVAIKRLLAARRRDPHSIRSFFKEIQLTSTLDHECIVQFLGVSWDIPANLCMVSEFMVGGDLRSLLASYALRGHGNGHDDTKLKMAVQVAHALTYLHTLSTPVVHRDLKSRNILLSSEGDAKLIDFGISCERQDVTMTAGVGTSLWMAPEVMLGQRYDEKADVFSFGVILSELDTHQLPYDHARDTVSGQPISSMVLMQLISEGRLKPRFTPMADPQMVALAKDCLEVNPANRPLASQVLYRIHQNRRNDRQMALDTRTAIDRSIRTVETNSTRREPTSP